MGTTAMLNLLYCMSLAVTHTTCALYLSSLTCALYLARLLHVYYLSSLINARTCLLEHLSDLHIVGYSWRGYGSCRVTLILTLIGWLLQGVFSSLGMISAAAVLIISNTGAGLEFNLMSCTVLIVWWHCPSEQACHFILSIGSIL